MGRRRLSATCITYVTLSERNRGHEPMNVRSLRADACWVPFCNLLEGTARGMRLKRLSSPLASELCCRVCHFEGHLSAKAADRGKSCPHIFPAGKSYLIVLSSSPPPLSRAPAFSRSVTPCPSDRRTSRVPFALLSPSRTSRSWTCRADAARTTQYSSSAR